MGDLKKILNPVARVAQAVAPFLAFTPAGPVGALAATLAFSAAAQSTRTGGPAPGAAQAAALAAVAGGIAASGLATATPGAQRVEMLEQNSAMQVAAMAAGVDVTETEGRNISERIRGGLAEMDQRARERYYQEQNVWNPRLSSAAFGVDASLRGVGGSAAQINGNLGFMANGLLQAIFGALAPELRGMNSTLAQILPLLISQGAPALLRATGALEFGAPRPLERLIAGTALGPSQMGRGMVSAYYNSPRAVAGHATAMRAAAEGDFLREVARARAIR